MAKVKGTKEIDCEWNGNTGKMVLTADLSAGTIMKIVKNCLNFDFKRGFTMDSVNYEEYVVQMAQKLIKKTPDGFDLNNPNNIRELDPDVWSEISKFIGKYYAIGNFLSDGMTVLFGEQLPEPSSSQKTDSITHVDVS